MMAVSAYWQYHRNESMCVYVDSCAAILMSGHHMLLYVLCCSKGATLSQHIE